MTIQWYPGHMHKARRRMTETMGRIDLVAEIVDARIPLASRNPMLAELTDEKPRLILLNKSDLVDDDELLDLADTSQLGRPDVLEPQVRRMLADPRAAALDHRGVG